MPPLVHDFYRYDFYYYFYNDRLAPIEQLLLRFLID